MKMHGTFGAIVQSLNSVKNLLLQEDDDDDEENEDEGDDADSVRGDKTVKGTSLGKSTSAERKQASFSVAAAGE